MLNLISQSSFHIDKVVLHSLIHHHMYDRHLERTEIDICIFFVNIASDLERRILDFSPFSLYLISFLIFLPFCYLNNHCWIVLGRCRITPGCFLPPKKVSHEEIVYFHCQISPGLSRPRISGGAAQTRPGLEVIRRKQSEG